MATQNQIRDQKQILYYFPVLNTFTCVYISVLAAPRHQWHDLWMHHFYWLIVHINEIHIIAEILQPTDSVQVLAGQKEPEIYCKV